MTVRYSKTLKKTVIIVLSLVLLLFGLTACGLGDWRYDELPGNYEVWHINSCQIVLGKADDDSSGLERCMDRYVLEFCSNDTYIGAMCRPYIDLEEWDQEDFDLYDATISYYLVDTSTDKVYGPYTFEEYKKCLEELQVGDLGKWIKTSPPPEGARYD